MLAPLVLVTDPAWSYAHTDAVVTAVARAVPRGAFAVQLRDKQATETERAARARALRALTTGLGVQLVVNGAPALACEVCADGAHVPGGASIVEARSIFAFGYLTAAAHDDEDVRRALREGADAVLVSPIFATPGKGAPRGVVALERARALVDATATGAKAKPLAVFALGGVDSQNARACAAAGADGVAVIRALLAAVDPAAAARAILDDLGRGLRYAQRPG